MSLASLLANTPPASEEVIVLTCVDVFFSVIFLSMSVYIAWKHGQPGINIWPPTIACPVARLAGDIYLLETRDQPLIPSAASTITDAAVQSCVCLGLVGVVYLCNIMLPRPPRRRVGYSILGAFNVVVTAGTSMVIPPTKALNIVGYLFLILVLLTVCLGMWPTYKKVEHFARVGHPNAAPARKLLRAGMVAMPFWMVRIVYGLVYAGTQLPVLNTVLGSFAVKFIVVFWMYVGAWVSIGWQRDVGSTVEYLGDQGLMTREADRERALSRDRRTATDDSEAAASVETGDAVTPVTEEVLTLKS